MAALMRAKDWSATPLGLPETWPRSLRMIVGLMLANRFPMLLWWGPDYLTLYNDPYRPVLGDKHPGSLGQPGRECWSAIWDILKPLVDTPFGGGPSTWSDDLALEINRHGFVEETHFTVAYSPVPDETASNGIGGVLATVHEITDKVIAERRVQAPCAILGCARARRGLPKRPAGSPPKALRFFRKTFLSRSFIFWTKAPPQRASRRRRVATHRSSITRLKSI